MCKFAVLLLRLCGSSREKNMRRKKFPVCIERMFTQLIIDSEHRKSMEFQYAVFLRSAKMYIFSHINHIRYAVRREGKGNIVVEKSPYHIHCSSCSSTLRLCRAISFIFNIVHIAQRKEKFPHSKPDDTNSLRVVRKSCSKNISLCFNVARRGCMGFFGFCGLNSKEREVSSEYNKYCELRLTIEWIWSDFFGECELECKDVESWWVEMSTVGQLGWFS